MPFTVELTFSGLGVVFIESPRERARNARGVVFALLGTENLGHRHFPRLWFTLKDLAEPKDRLFEEIPVGADGDPLGFVDVAGQHLEMRVEGADAAFDINWAPDASSVEPGREAPADAIDWIPDIDRHLGLDPIVLPDDEGGRQLYATTVRLPPGYLTSRHILRNPGFGRARWNFGERDEGGPARVLAEQVVWSRSNLTSLRIGGLRFDAGIREAEGERNIRLPLALSNRPRGGVSGRFTTPEHFGHLEALALRGARIREVTREEEANIGPITPGGACPPARKEIILGAAKA